jgi:cytochrome c553
MIGFMAVLLALPVLAQNEVFLTGIRPVLTEHCASCHGPDNPRNKVGFLRARSDAEMLAERGMWRKVSQHLRNRTMPPVANRLSEHDRLFISNWVEERLRSTACAQGEQAGAVTARRLNRREYRNTIRDLFGIDYPVEDLFPADGSGGEGFDNNGETLFVPPLLLERYLESAQQILDRVIITPSISKTILINELLPARNVPKEKSLKMMPGEEVPAKFAVLLDGDYDIRVVIDRPRDREVDVFVAADGGEPVRLRFQKDANGGATSRNATFRLGRGPHTFAARMGDHPIDFFGMGIQHRQPVPSSEKKAMHHRLFRMEPGEVPVDPRESARRLLARFLPRVFRRPVTEAETARYVALYDRAAKRGDLFEEAVKLALKAALVSPEFLFRVEKPAASGITPVGDFELASRLSYFLWATMPDEELLLLAGAGKLREQDVLSQQVERMLDDPRSRAFANAFIGQWLGTKDVGGRAAPTVASVQHFYTPETAIDLREEPVMLFQYIVEENRSLMELFTAPYTFLTERLAKFYELEGKVAGVEGNSFRKVNWPDANRAGILGMGSVLALTSHYQETSPVLRGAWILDTLLGTPAPAPPADVPPLEPGDKKYQGMTARQKLEKHRSQPSCSACHDLIDPLGFGLENFDWLGRWRERDAGQPVDARGKLPTGETFNGPIELRSVLLAKKDELARTIAAKTLGYALGRSLGDADQCVIQRLVEEMGRNDYRARSLVRAVVHSVPFRFSAPVAATDIEETRIGSRSRVFNRAPK